VKTSTLRWLLEDERRPVRRWLLRSARRSCEFAEPRRRRHWHCVHRSSCGVRKARGIPALQGGGGSGRGEALSQASAAAPAQRTGRKISWQMWLPDRNGGLGSYSGAKCVNFAASSPRNFARSTSPKSIPAVTPPPVMRFRSTATRASTGSAPNALRASRVAGVVMLVLRSDPPHDSER
jgi:hypothetical protein